MKVGGSSGHRKNLTGLPLRVALGLPKLIFRQGVGRSTSEPPDLSQHCSDCEEMLVCAPFRFGSRDASNQSADDVRSKQEVEEMLLISTFALAIAVMAIL